MKIIFVIGSKVFNYDSSLVDHNHLVLLLQSLIRLGEQQLRWGEAHQSAAQYPTQPMLPIPIIIFCYLLSIFYQSISRLFFLYIIYILMTVSPVILMTIHWQGQGTADHLSCLWCKSKIPIQDQEDCNQHDPNLINIGCPNLPYFTIHLTTILTMMSCSNV